MNTDIHRTIYKFGSLLAGEFGAMVLRPDGAVGVYDHPRERRYALSGGVLRFFDGAGAVTSQLEWRPDARLFLSDNKEGVFLRPTVTAPAALQGGLTQRIFVNTVPKSGTYLLHHVLEAIGYRSLRLHLDANAFMDCRAVDIAEAHRDPDHFRRPCPARAIAAIMQPGQFAVGHIDDAAECAAIAATGVRIIACVRDLRDALVSLFRFKRDRVASVSPADDLWRRLDGGAAFAGFLVEFAARDIAQVGRVAAMIAGSGLPTLHFESFRLGGDLETAADLFGAIEPSARHAFAAAARRSLGAPTSTWSGALSEWRPHWSAPVEDFFAATGLRAVNEALGYCATQTEKALTAA